VGLLDVTKNEVGGAWVGFQEGHVLEETKQPLALLHEGVLHVLHRKPFRHLSALIRIPNFSCLLEKLACPSIITSAGLYPSLIRGKNVFAVD
jgi:hypothetical protein